MLKRRLKYGLIALLSIIIVSCSPQTAKNHHPPAKTAAQILGDSNYLAISYGGYRHTTRDSQPSLAQIKEDMKLLYAMGIKVLRTYNTKYKEVENILEAISALQKEDSNFEMYLMLGAWIECENAWTNKVPNHDKENEIGNTEEIQRAVALAIKYPGIVKIISVGNEARVKWATNYFVQTDVILKWVNYLQNLKKEHKLDQDLWITSSDNFASWGGGDTVYHVKDLENLVKAVDFVSLHTYPMHDTHYNPEFWYTQPSETKLPKKQAVERIMQRAVWYAQQQYANTAKYIRSIDSTKPVHIGETGWASTSDGFYGSDGAKACDEYKSGVYYRQMRTWTNQAKISCFYFEAFDEHWKDPLNQQGSENHFGLLTINGQAKYALWHWVDNGAFKGLTRDGKAIAKTHRGNLNTLLENIELPPLKR